MAHSSCYTLYNQCGKADKTTSRDSHIHCKFVCCVFCFAMSYIFTSACMELSFSLQRIFNGQGLLIEASRLYLDTPPSVGLLWTNDQPHAVTCTRKHTTLTRDRHLYPRWGSNRHYLQASGHRPTR
jgi:hypothetical protein